MIIFEEETRDALLLDQLFQVWEQSVRATHLFLSENNIKMIAEYVPGALKHIPVLIVAREQRRALPAAFMGIEGKRLEMLFVHPAQSGRGLGKRLLQYGVENHGLCEVCVNEQNPQAAGFYGHMGFKTYKRTELDEQGNAFPLLYMRLEK